MTFLLLAIGLGAFFGIALDRVGATNPENIINMLRLKDLTLMKIIFGAIGLASIGLFGGIELGLISASHLSIKAAYIGVLVGGALLGIGFAIAGYCPGTGLSALATGRKDAGIFVLGGLAGALAFMLTFDSLQHTFLFDKVGGGKATLGLVDGVGAALLPGVNGHLLGIALGVGFILIAALLPSKKAGA